ncbi:DUF4129 domain-containing protein [Microbacterium terrisoli]|uniref:DUF4129 domain-containing protein n=1 Tax=Microbacterium terrisoli TaxID=3242192 RepID=UPI002804E15F|nr:DUF4129 domain-containing protein [Microbacterium protaetiae]
MIVLLADDAPPLTPDAEQARQWAQHELSDPAYAAAHPTPIDRMARAVQDFFASLFSGSADGVWAVWLAVGVAVVLIALIVVAVVLSGRSRLSRRTAAGQSQLFGDVETRSAAELRRTAAAAADAQDWSEAVILRFRALARGTVERGAVDLTPGATTHSFARAAGRVFPAHAGAVDAAADAFDDVRYLRRPGTADLYATVARADDGVRADRPLDGEPAPHARERVGAGRSSSSGSRSHGAAE